MTLNKGQYSLGGYVFGTVDDPVVVLAGGLDKGNAEPRTQDADHPFADSALFGRDFLGTPSWGFTLGVLNDEGNVQDVLDELAAVWRADDIRSKPGAYMALKYNLNGRQRVIYGRPRRYAEQPAENADDQWSIVETDFKLLEARCYEDYLNRLDMTLLETGSSGGLVLPAVLPWELERSSSTRQGVVTVGGRVATPLKITFKGPAVGTLSNPSIVGPGFAIDLDTTVKYDEEIVIDTRARTVLKDGVSVAGALSRRSRLDVLLTPGTTEISFSGNDPSNTALCRVEWRSAYPL